MKNGWKLVSLRYNGKNIMRSKKIKLGKNYGTITLVVQNKKTRVQSVYRLIVR